MENLPAEKVENMFKRYQDGLTLNQVAHEFGYLTGVTVGYHFKRRGFRARARGGAIKASQKGEQNGFWKGGRVVSNNRVRVWNPSHPNSHKNGYVSEHILIASKILGRPFQKGEVVHHIDGNGFNNKNSNLIICKQSLHALIHLKDALRKGKPILNNFR